MTPATTSGKTNGRPKVGIFGLTGCAGDQLQILNCEDELVRLSQRLDIVDWVMAKSDNDRTSRLDVAFVEGVVATQKDLDTLKEIRAKDKDLLVVMFTTETEKDSVTEILKAGANDYIVKPIDREFVLNKLRGLLQA